MPAKRWAAVAVSSLLLSSVLLSQSLVEIAQKERERRAALKGKKTVVVTNAELAKVKRKSAVEVAALPPAATLQKPAPAAPPDSAGPEPPEPPVSTVAPPSAPPVPAARQELQERWDKAKEYVELLTMKMGALYQEFNALRDPYAQEAVRKTISETYAKLQTAQEEEIKARLEFEKFIGEAKKKSTPSLWIK
jgi:hypothetical protein